MNPVASLLAGVLFGAGLVMSGMTDITKVIGFLDLFGNFDPSLAFVMAGGLAVTFPFFQLVLPRLSKPLFAVDFSLPTRRDIDMLLIASSVLFGVGWGVVGLCPGPAIATLSYLDPDIVVFVVAMTLGLFLGGLLTSRMGSPPTVEGASS